MGEDGVNGTVAINVGGLGVFLIALFNKENHLRPNPNHVMCKVLFIFVISLALFRSNTLEAANEQTNCDWVYERFIDLTDHLVTDRTIAESERKGYVIHFYQFAFDYWLISRTNQIAAPFHWRGRIRQLLHRVNNAERFQDPADVAAFFTNGAIVLPPFPYWNGMPGTLAGIDRDKFSVAQYRGLVEGFELAFADFYTVFPPDPAPTNTTPFASPELERRAGPFAQGQFRGERWPSAHLESLGPQKVLDLLDGQEKIEKRYDDTPPEVFMALTPKAQAYYMPAFLLFCERHPDRSEGVLSLLLKQLTGSSKESEALRAGLSPLQKKVIVAYFENWCVHDIAPSKIRKLHDTLIKD